jgi:hypothetical protein
LFLQLDTLPRRITQYHIEATPVKDFGKLQGPVEEAMALGKCPGNTDQSAIYAMCFQITA